jgi:hypothetical protein
MNVCMIIRAVGGEVAGAFLSEVPKVCRTGLGMYVYVCMYIHIYAHHTS